MIAVCVVAFLFPSGKSSGQKKTKAELVTTATTATTADDHSATSTNDAVVVDKKTV